MTIFIILIVLIILAIIKTSLDAMYEIENKKRKWFIWNQTNMINLHERIA